jgi:hypothetical protein
VKLRDDTNEYGTPVSVHRCDTCGVEFTVCPSVPDGSPRLDDWGSCLAETCDSYDIARDVDMFFEPAFELGWIRRSGLSS